MVSTIPACRAIKRLLVIDDSAEIGGLIAAIAQPLGYTCLHATTFEQFKAFCPGDADVIVVGSHGSSEGDHTALGDTADNVLRHAPGHVFVVRIPAPEFVI